MICNPFDRNLVIKKTHLISTFGVDITTRAARTPSARGPAALADGKSNPTSAYGTIGNFRRCRPTCGVPAVLFGVSILKFKSLMVSIFALAYKP